MQDASFAEDFCKVAMDMNTFFAFSCKFEKDGKEKPTGNNKEVRKNRPKPGGSPYPF